MAKGFSLAEFSPEGMDFEDNGFGGDGKVYQVKTLEHLGARDTVTLQRLYNRMGAALTGQSKGDEEVLATQLEQTADDLFRLLVPTLPDERHKAIPFQAKFRFLTWWRKEQTPPRPAAEAEAGTGKKSKRTRRGRVGKKPTPLPANSSLE